ncbi:hypothetical protein DRP05_01885 [Archaeoglobales archaeon]|nr:MAG: hypothetical protein DRP05_01885 [Archaeoglobales archaeon]
MYVIRQLFMCEIFLTINMVILNPKFGEDFIGREKEIEELKEKIEKSGIVVVTGDRGVGKTILIHVVKELLEKEPGHFKKWKHYHINGSMFYEKIRGIFKLPFYKRITGISTPFGGISLDSAEHNILECMEKSKDKIIFIENAHELEKKDIEIISTAVDRTNRLKFVLEIAKVYLPNIKLKGGSYEVIEVKELSYEDIEKIVRKEYPNFSDDIIEKIVTLSEGYPYIARTLAYICNNKSKEEQFQFLDTLKDGYMRHTLDKIHEEILGTLDKSSQELLKCWR